MIVLRWLSGVAWRLLLIPGLPTYWVLGTIYSILVSVVLTPVLYILTWILTGNCDRKWIHAISRASWISMVCDYPGDYRLPPFEQRKRA